MKGGVPYADRIRHRTRLLHRLSYRQEQLTRSEGLKGGDEYVHEAAVPASVSPMRRVLIFGVLFCICHGKEVLSCLVDLCRKAPRFLVGFFISDIRC